MPVMVTMTWADMTAEKYAAVWPAPGDERLNHVAAVDGSTLHVTDVWSTAKAARAYLDHDLLPAAAKAGVSTTPEVVVLPALFVQMAAEAAPPEPGTATAGRRILLIANRTLGAPQLAQALEARLSDGNCAVHVLVPIAPPRHLLPADGQDFADPVIGAENHPGTSAERARHRLYAELDRLHAQGTTATGEVGAADPLESVRALLAEQRFDEVILSTLPAGMSRWLRMDLPSRLQRAVTVPVSVVIAPALDD